MPPLNRGFFFAVLTPVQIYVVVLPPVRFLALSEKLVELEHFSGKSGT